MLSTAHMPSQMQGMDRKYDDHVWCKVITININNSFGLHFKKAPCLGHLWCLHDKRGSFVHTSFAMKSFGAMIAHIF